MEKVAIVPVRADGKHLEFDKGAVKESAEKETSKEYDIPGVVEVTPAPEKEQGVDRD